MEEVRTIGRLVYIEPNNIRSELGGIRYGNGDNIAWRPEDLNISVDLQVIIPDRDSCGQTDIGDNFIVNISSADGTSREWQSFFSGTELKDKEKSLTTEYTDISYQEIRNNKAGGKENLGIQSIDIQFDSHFFPIVKMKITDVRGYSLMQPAEMQYKSDLEARKNKEVPNKACEQFFSALFHFPYPRFALSIKGFYGNRVTFMLAVNDFQSSFNSQTGNFDVEISFIGHMYGFYADLPLTALLVAPYIGSMNGGVNNYWDSQVHNGVFMFSDGTPIPTIKDFILMYEKMDEKFKELQANDGNKFEKLTKVDNLRIEREHLNNLLDEYKKLFDNIGRDADGASHVETTRTIGNIILYFTYEDALNPSSYESMSAAYRAYKEFLTKNNKDANVIDEPKDAIWDSKIPSEAPLYIRNEETGEFNIDTKHKYYENLKDKVERDGKSILTDAQKEQRFILVTKDLDFEHKINERLLDIENETTALIKESTDEIQEITKNILGMNPTIENVIRMIFAHIDAFMHAFYEVLGNIDTKKKNGQRLLRNIRGLSLDSTNIEAKGTENCFIPPFATYYTTDKSTKERVKAYSDSIDAIRNFDEVKFVDSICEAINAVNKDIEKSRNTDTVATITETWTKLSVLDVLEYRNPYREFSQNTSADKYANELVKFVDKRFSEAIANSQAERLTVEQINSEIENFWAINGKDLSTATDRNKTIKQNLEKLVNEKELQSVLSKEIANAKDKYGFHIIEEGANTDGLSSTIVNNDWDYTADNDFIGNIYPNDVLDDKIIYARAAMSTEGKTEGGYKSIIADSRRNESVYCFPVVPIYRKDGKKVVAENFFTYLQNKTNELNGPMPILNENVDDFISCLVGTGDIFRFTNTEWVNDVYVEHREGGIIVRMPKNIALFLGCAIVNENFKISSDGLYYYSGNTVANKLGTNNITIEALKKYDESRKTLSKFYTDWREKEGKSIVNSGITAVSSEQKVSFGGNQISVIDNSELVSSLIKLNNSTVDILLINPKGGMRDTNAILSFIKGIIDKMEAERQDADNGESSFALSTGKSGFSRELIKEQMYYTLADLYDKWLAGYSEERFKLKLPSEDEAITKDKLNATPNSKGKHITEIENFMYIDTFYNDIGKIFLVDPKTVVDAFLRNNGETYTSALQAISDIAFNNKLLFIPLPVFTNLYSGKDIASIFTPQGLYGKNEFSFRDMSRGIGSTYILMYTHEPSKHSFTGKDVGNTTTYSRDYLDLADTTGNVNAIDIQDLNKTENGIGYTIPAFGVTFAKQNQMYFKNINVSMANPRQTDVAIQNTLNLADMEKRGNTRNAAVTIGQDLFSIYSNRAYDCTVEMMGCMDIVPTMYFQLNNIPLFKGAYRVVSVKHHIENGAMTTTFSGTRINKNAIPFNNNVIDIEGLYTKLKEKRADDNESSITAGGQDKAIEVYPTYYVPGYWIESEKYPVFHVPHAAYRFKYTMHFNPKEQPSYDLIPYYNEGEYAKRGMCATAIKQALCCGIGVTVDNFGSIGNGYRCYTRLEKEGFRCLTSGKTQEELINYSPNCEAGDIALIRRERHSDYGHICMYDGKVWMSDYHQHDASGYKKGTIFDGWWIYRYQGRRITENSVFVTISSNTKFKIGNKEYESGIASYEEAVERDKNNGRFSFDFFVQEDCKCEAYTFFENKEEHIDVALKKTKRNGYTYSIIDKCDGIDTKNILKNLVIEIKKK